MTETKKRAIEIIKDEKAPVVEKRMTKVEAQAFVDSYAKKNPAKYATKKKALEAWVATF